MRQLDFTLSGFTEEQLDNDLRSTTERKSAPVSKTPSSIAGLSPSIGWTIFCVAIVFTAVPLRAIYNVKLKSGVSLREAAQAVQLAKRPGVGTKATIEKAVEIARATKAAKENTKLTPAQSMWAAELVRRSSFRGEFAKEDVPTMAQSVKDALANDSPLAARVQSISLVSKDGVNAVFAISPAIERVTIQCNVVRDGPTEPHSKQTDGNGRVEFNLKCVGNNDMIWAAVVLNGIDYKIPYAEFTKIPDSAPR